MSNNFSRILRESRTRKGHSQRQAADALGVQQSSISAWESGKQAPGDDDVEKVERLRSYLEIERDELLAALRPPPDMSALPLLSQRGYLDEQQTYIEYIGSEFVDLWLLGPSTLPVTRSEDVRAVWQQNLRSGVHYCIIWFLDLVAKDDLRHVAALLRELGEGVQRDPSLMRTGHIHHYPIFAYEPDPQVSRLYDGIRRENLPLNDFKSTLETPMPRDHLKRLLQYYNPYGSITVCRTRPNSGKAAFDPLAAIGIPGYRNKRRGPSADGFCILPDEHARRLSDITDGIYEIFSGQAPHSERQ